MCPVRLISFYTLLLCNCHAALRSCYAMQSVHFPLGPSNLSPEGIARFERWLHYPWRRMLLSVLITYLILSKNANSLHPFVTSKKVLRSNTCFSPRERWCCPSPGRRAESARERRERRLRSEARVGLRLCRDAVLIASHRGADGSSNTPCRVDNVATQTMLVMAIKVAQARKTTQLVNSNTQTRE